MPEPPDFEQIARTIIGLTDREPTIPQRVPTWDDVTRRIAEQLRQVWNAGKEAGTQHETFAKHLADENTAAHLALDRLNAPTTKQVPTREGTGKQDITIGLAERIDAQLRQVWNARGAADISAIDDQIARSTDEENGIVVPPPPRTFVRAIKKLDR